MSEAEAMRAAETISAELRKWWSFDDGQRHTHTWHDREDFIGKALPGLLAPLLADAAAMRALEGLATCSVNTSFGGVGVTLTSLGGAIYGDGVLLGEGPTLAAAIAAATETKP